VFGFLVDEQDNRTILQEKKRIQDQSKSMLDPGQVQVNHRENRSCQRWGALSCRETGKVAGIEVAEGRFSRAAGLRWRSFGFRRRTGAGSGTAV
jgi:hypothetical protein